MAFTFLWARQEIVVVPARALVLFIAYCAIGGAVMAYNQPGGMTAIDSIYFCVVTMSTVGYGDISPGTPWLKAFVILLIFVGIVCVFTPVASAINLLITNRITSAGRNMIEQRFPPVLIDIDGDGTEDFPAPDTFLMYYAKNLMPSVLLMCIIQALCAWGFVEIEAWGFGDALYHTWVTGTTVGYGDMSINTEEGRVWACFHIVLSVSMIGEIISLLDTLRSERAKVVGPGGLLEQAANKLDPETSDNLLQTAAELTLSGGGGVPAGVTKQEFILGMLIQSGVVNHEDVKVYQGMFEKQQVGKDGVLEKQKLESAIQEMQVKVGEGVAKCSPAVLKNLEVVIPPPPVVVVTEAPPAVNKWASLKVAAKAAKVAPLAPPPPPPPPPPKSPWKKFVNGAGGVALRLMAPKWKHDAASKVQARVRGHLVRAEMKRKFRAATKIQAIYRGKKTRQGLAPSDEQLKEVAKQVQAELSENYDIDYVELDVVMKQIKLLKPIEFKGSKSTTDVEFADDALANRICQEIGQILMVTNHSLEAMKFKPFFLEIGGHTSGGSNSSSGEKISLLRARAVRKLVVKELEKKGSRAEVEAKGYGSSMKLPGYDDGGNYEQNRRVEIKLV